MRLNLLADALPAHVFASLSHLLTSAPTALALACSGGADSRALALMAKDWGAAHRCALHLLIVDHGLREASAEEAIATANWAQTHGLSAHILTLAMDKQASGLQERARLARYNAMTDWCHAHSISHLLLGHHADDHIETVLFRLLRGSGIHGLAGISVRRTHRGIQLLRPLLDVPKSALLSYLRDKGEPWIEDPSNQNVDFSRTQMRQFLQAQCTEDQRARLWHFAQSCGQMRHQDESFLNAQMQKHVTLHPAGYAKISTCLMKLPEAQACWMLSRLLTHINGDETSPRYAQVAALREELFCSPNEARSLHQCLIFQRHNKWIICREPARAASALPCVGGQCLRWDKRFVIETHGLAEPCEIRPLGQSGYALLKESLPDEIPRRAVLSLPALWHLEAPVCVPHIGYSANKAWKNRFTASFSPAKALAETPFFLMNNDA